MQGERKKDAKAIDRVFPKVVQTPKQQKKRRKWFTRSVLTINI